MKKNAIDYPLLLFIVPLLGAGLLSMYSFTGETNFFQKQLLWIVISLVVFTAASFIDFSFLQKGKTLIILYGVSVLLLVLLFFVGSTIKGAQSWFDFGGFSFQPVDFAKITLVLVLSKYFSRRHIEISRMKHIIISAIYMLIPFSLVLLQPDFGSAMVLFAIWFGMALISGISKKHLFILAAILVSTFFVFWSFVFAPYQKARITSFLNPLTDIQGAGYNAYQSLVAVGSGQVLGKGVGYGTQSRLQFLPENETDFIFASFAEEWGFVGVSFFLMFLCLVILRLCIISLRSSNNFEMLFGIGVACMIVTHSIVNIGMNIGLLPVTGINLPFVSYGGSYLVMLFLALGMLMGMRRFSQKVRYSDRQKDFVGL
ncbi:MAG: rod shape determining protein RodA [Flavobacteriaceae bacterium]|jgi:rod shape determining protein RodA